MTKQQDIIEDISGKKILVIGDLMLDKYIKGSSQRLCREAPVPIVDMKKVSLYPGGAGNSAINVKALGAQPLVFSVIGDDKEAGDLIEIFKNKNISIDAILKEAKRKTLTKTRVFSDKQLMVRYDYGSTNAISTDFEKKIIDLLIKTVEQVDGVIISDYGYGIITPAVLKKISSLTKRYNVPLIVDAKDFNKYQKIKILAIKPNYEESRKFLRIPHKLNGSRVRQIYDYQNKFFQKLNTRFVAVTLDMEGSIFLEKGKKPFRIPVKPALNSQAVGAGDTFTCALTLGLVSGLVFKQAGEIAVAASTVVVNKEETTSCSAQELKNYFHREFKKINSREELLEKVRDYKNYGYKIVFTNGCFDLLHAGHIEYLSQAKKLGDILIVGLNSDSSVRKLKGSERPINSLEDRMQVLSALSAVDHVVAFDEDTPINLIKIIRPQVFVKGGDYKKNQLPEAPVVEKNNGQVIILPYIKNHSTTAIINQIRQLSYY